MAERVLTARQLLTALNIHVEPTAGASVMRLVNILRQTALALREIALGQVKETDHAELFEKFSICKEKRIEMIDGICDDFGL